MSRHPSLALILAALFQGCSATSESVIEDAADALGGAEAIAAANTLVLEGTGQTYRLHQQLSPDADLPVYELHEYRREVDLQNKRWRVDQVRTGHFISSSPVNRQPLSQAVDGGVAYDVRVDGSAARLNAQTARDRHAEFYHHPLPLLKAALEGGTTLGEVREEAGGHAVDITPVGGPRLTLHVDEAGIPTRIESTGYNPMLGDVVIATSFSDWEESGDLTLPRTISQTLDKYRNGDFTVSNEVNGDIRDLAAPDDVASAPDPVPPPTEVTSERLAAGVWYLRAGYNSTLIEFPSFGVLVEAPRNDQHTLAVIEKAREILDEKPLQYVINTHFHSDHSGGIRAAVAEGLTVITHELHRAFFEEVVARPHTVIQDHLAQNPRPLSIETVSGDGPYEMTEGNRTLVIHRLKNSTHADGMLLVYLPQERIMIEGDPFTPGRQAPPREANLLEQVRALGLRIDRFAPIHGDVATFAELVETVRAIGG